MVLTTEQLFLSNRIVLENDVIAGGVLVDNYGIIAKIIEKKEIDGFIKENDGQVKIIDGGNNVLLAGVVDSHVHVNEPGRTAWEGFRTATNAAASGGITTIVDMPLNSIPPTTTLDNLKTKASAAKGNVYVDVGFWGGVIPGNEESLQDLIKAGVVGFKCFLCPSGVDEFPHVTKEDLNKAFAELEGSQSVLAFHAELEDAEICHESKSKINKKDPEEYNTYLESRPPKMELNAISLITSLLDRTDVRVHIVHVSSADVVPLLAEARLARQARNVTAWRGGLTSETCHHYLNLNAEIIPKGHSEYKCAPPIRDLNNKEKLWEFLLNDKIDMVVSDHSPCTPDLKCSNNLEAWGGISSVQFGSAQSKQNIKKAKKQLDAKSNTPIDGQTGLSLFYTAISDRGLPLNTISKYLSSAPAHLCGLQNRKGAIKPGLDADLVYFDPEASFLITTDIIKHKNKLTPYLNKELKGVIRQTYLRGQLIYDEGIIIGEPKGELLLNDFK